jgi:hypothetical protein
MVKTPGNTVPSDNEIVAVREQFYVPASLDEHVIFCGDDREAAEAIGIYIHLFGGALNVAYNLAVMQEALSPDSVKDSFQARAVETVAAMKAAGTRPGVHSDTIAEKDAQGIGCGYAGQRGPISGLIFERGEDIITDAKNLRPELFEQPESHSFARAAVDAHGRLATRAGFLTDGRAEVMGSVEEGASLMLVKGEHVAEEGIINLVPETSIDSSAANKAGLAVYDQDSWAAEDINRRLAHLHSYDGAKQAIAELIDTVGTMRALGVKDIAVRRPQ